MVSSMSDGTLSSIQLGLSGHEELDQIQWHTDRGLHSYGQRSLAPGELLKNSMAK